MNRFQSCRASFLGPLEAYERLTSRALSFGVLHLNHPHCCDAHPATSLKAAQNAYGQREGGEWTLMARGQPSRTQSHPGHHDEASQSLLGTDVQGVLTTSASVRIRCVSACSTRSRIHPNRNSSADGVPMRRRPPSSTLDCHPVRLEPSVSRQISLLVCSSSSDPGFRFDDRRDDPALIANEHRHDNTTNMLGLIFPFKSFRKNEKPLNALEVFAKVITAPKVSFLSAVLGAGHALTALVRDVGLGYQEAPEARGR